MAKTAHSYTYTQPNTTILYHGTLEVVPDGKDHSKILYNLIWDQAALTSDEAKTKDRDRSHQGLHWRTGEYEGHRRRQVTRQP